MRGYSSTSVLMEFVPRWRPAPVPPLDPALVTSCGPLLVVRRQRALILMMREKGRGNDLGEINSAMVAHGLPSIGDAHSLRLVIEGRVDPRSTLSGIERKYGATGASHVFAR